MVLMAGANSCSNYGNVWFQREISLKAKRRGCHLITEEICRHPDIRRISIGIAHIYIKHTSASLAINENWDQDARIDTEMALTKLVPESWPFQHSCEGPDDMPAHIKACLFGASLTIPVTNGALNLGRWQGIWMCEHRNNAGPRQLVITLQGCPFEDAKTPP